MKKVIGWADAYTSPYQTVEFTNEREEALIHRIRKRQYNFNHQDHQFLSFAAPFYDDGFICVLTKSEWDHVMQEAYKDEPRGSRKMPIDVIEIPPINNVLWEKEKWVPKGDN